LHNVLAARTAAQIVVGNVRLSPANPLSEPITTDIAAAVLSQAHVIVVDDVANSGRTMFYALRPLMDIPTRQVEVAVLIDRTHKTYPVRPDYVGLSLATTLLEDIQVYLYDDQNWQVTLS
jgi:pyrimidine operon attenuation protein/uracil phosphoribosyltransferase